MPRVKREDTELVGLLASDGDRSRSGQQGSTSAGISLNANSSRYPGVVNELDTDDIYDEEQLEGGTRGLHGAQEAQGQQRAHAARDSMRSAWRAARGQWSRIAHAGLHGPRAAMACLALGGFCASLILLLVISAALGASEGGGSGGGAGGARVLRKGEPTVLPMCSRSAPRTYCGSLSVDKGGCEAQGCCWDPSPSLDPSAPPCFRPNAGKTSSVSVASDSGTDGQYVVRSSRSTALGSELQLELPGRGPLPDYGPCNTHLTVTLEAQSKDRARLRITPASADGTTAVPRYEVPEELVPRPPARDTPPASPQYSLRTAAVGDVFWAEVVRANSSGSKGEEVLFSSRGWRMVFKEQYMQITTSVDLAAVLYGLGETVLPSGTTLPRTGKVITLWNYDSPAFGPTNVNVYGSHPFLMQLHTEGAAAGHASGLLLLNSHAMDVELWPDSATFRVLGGVLDFYVFAGPSPEDVLRQYHAVIGKPAMPPLWALGLHQSRWGYEDAAELLGVVEAYRVAGLPLDAIWSDIDYMSSHRVFTLDSRQYPEATMRHFVDGLHERHMAWVPILDPAVAADPDWEVYASGLAARAFVTHARGSDDAQGNGRLTLSAKGVPTVGPDAYPPYIGQVWAGASAWPDYLSSHGAAWWNDQVTQFVGKMPADGIWLDMNEPSNFCPGVACHQPSSALRRAWNAVTKEGASCVLECDAPGDDDQLSHPPYMVNNHGNRAPLWSQTVPPSALHVNGTVPHYAVHNMYSLAQAKATYQALASATGRRPFLLCRASFPGLGAHCAHWTGDNGATWDDLRWSVAGVLNSGLWGMSMAGADICGFSGDTTEELCARWLEAGSFYPFMRDHNTKESGRQEAYLWPGTRVAARAALALRHRLLPYWYTAAFNASTYGGAIARPLFMDWPSDERARAASDTQWLIGRNVMAAPVLTHSTQHVTPYFPPATTWFHLVTGAVYAGGSPSPPIVPAAVGTPPAFVRGGAILPLSRTPGLTTHDTGSSGLILLMALHAGSCSPSAGMDMGDGALVGVSDDSGDSEAGAAGSSGEGGAGGMGGMGGSSGNSNDPPATAWGTLYWDDGVGLELGSPASSTHVAFSGGCYKDADSGGWGGWLTARSLFGNDSAAAKSGNGVPALEVWGFQAWGMPRPAVVESASPPPPAPPPSTHHSAGADDFPSAPGSTSQPLLPLRVRVYVSSGGQQGGGGGGEEVDVADQLGASATYEIGGRGRVKVKLAKPVSLAHFTRLAFDVGAR